MRTISPDTRKLIDQLYEPISLWERLSHTRRLVETLTNIGNSAEPAAIIDMLPFVLADKKDVAVAASAAVHKLTNATSTVRLNTGVEPKEAEWSGYTLKLVK